MRQIQLSRSQLRDWKLICAAKQELPAVLSHLQKQSEPIISASSLRDSVSTTVSSGDIATAIVRQLVAVAAFRRDSALTNEQAAADILDALNEELDDFDDQNLRNFLINGLMIDTVNLCAKALFLSYNSVCIYRKGHVITDIRPVFSEERTDSIFGAVVLQSLFVQFLQDGRKREVQLSMDSDDVDNLIEQLQRAKIKADAAKAHMNSDRQVPSFLAGEETFGF